MVEILDFSAPVSRALLSRLGMFVSTNNAKKYHCTFNFSIADGDPFEINAPHTVRDINWIAVRRFRFECE